MSDLLSEVHTEASRIGGLLTQRGDFQGRLYLADEIVKLRHAWEDGHASGRCEASTECASLEARLKEAEEFIKSLKRSHLIVEEDCWYSCPSAVDDDGEWECCNDKAERKCNCGAERWNERIDAFLRGCQVTDDAERRAANAHYHGNDEPCYCEYPVINPAEWLFDSVLDYACTHTGKDKSRCRTDKINAIDALIREREIAALEEALGEVGDAGAVNAIRALIEARRK